MKLLAAQPKLVELVQDAILAEIASGKLRPGARIIQEQIAQGLGVSRQPVQQALLVLRNLGVLREAPGRGLQVAPLDLDHIRNMYDMRAVIEGLAFRKAAERNARRAAEEGASYIDDGRAAVAASDMARMIEADMAFHSFIYELSGNPLVAPTMESHWTNTQRVMGEVLMRDERPRDIWDQHEELLQAVVAGDGKKAERLARQHIEQAADFMIDRLKREAARAN
ncbi:GntR family transcriptional regulator [Ramlibacter sp. PS4R-6]|uniref:GntR family transcriptional regulator n=1 Tax=Ramlibacter sp. PS4R-6 TaxID=3133438 RepID=UPI0030B075E9